jgi:hypothetical protein
MKRFCLAALLAVAAMLIAGNLAQASVTAAAYYRLGEADAGAVAGNPGNATTEDSGANNMDLTNWAGTQTYSSNVAASAAAAVGSSLSMNFAGNGFYLTQANCLTGATDNFGIEGWFNINSLTQMGLACNGDGLGPAGFGLYVLGGKVQGYYCQLALFDSGFAPTPGEWFYAALVRDGGITRMYVNNSNEITVANNTATPYSAANAPQFSLGIVSYDAFAGLADEVRVFTFEPGAFNASTDLLIAVPEPSTVTLLATGLFGLMAYAWRKRK